MKNLIGMTDFALEQGNPSNTDSQFADKVMAYANFLKQPLELWMFVPCDEDGNVLDSEPCSLGMFEKGNPYYDVYLKDKNEYQQAKERCLFEGFEICDRQEEVNCLVFDNEHFSIKHILSGTIEDLVKYNLKLTPTAQKQIGL